MKKIAVITTTRAEYGLLTPLIRRMNESDIIAVRLIVSGTHLLEKYGNTVQYIMQDGMEIAYRLPIFDEDYVSTEINAVKAVARAAEQMAEVFEREAFDAMIVLGDRFELLGFCDAAAICRIPIIHIHGGEITEGAIDDKIRHSVTKLASIHFPSIQEYADRIVQMGEDPVNVHVVGALGIDNILKLELLDKQQLFDDIGVDTDRPVAAVTFHPVTTHAPSEAAYETRQVINALISSGVYSIITMPNSDAGGDLVYQQILQAVDDNPDRIKLCKSLGQLRYLSLLKCADIMIGNSSSGILESASFCLPTVNIGDRQKGRMAPANVIHCECDEDNICKAIDKALSEKFRKDLLGYVNPYGDGNAAGRMVEIIESTDFHDVRLVAKRFCDM